LWASQEKKVVASKKGTKIPPLKRNKPTLAYKPSDGVYQKPALNLEKADER